jgi:hypothetical protein
MHFRLNQSLPRDPMLRLDRRPVITAEEPELAFGYMTKRIAEDRWARPEEKKKAWYAKGLQGFNDSSYQLKKIKIINAFCCLRTGLFYACSGDRYQEAA